MDEDSMKRCKDRQLQRNNHRPIFNSRRFSPAPSTIFSSSSILLIPPASLGIGRKIGLANIIDRTVGDATDEEEPER